MVLEAVLATTEPLTLRADDLVAAYSVTQSAQTGEWVAVGTVRREGERQHGPVWVLVGVGISESLAVDDLQRELEHASERAR